MVDNTPIARLFVLAGQSNVLGFASLDHLLRLDDAQENDDNRLLTYRYTAPGTATSASPQWIQRNNVFVTFDREYGDRRPTTIEGKLQANLYGADDTKFGPEVGFGNLMGDYFGGKNSTVNDPVIVLKAGGVAPLAAEWNAVSNGEFYALMVADIDDTLARVSQITENAATEAEFCGMVWFHGYADVFNPEFLADYETNLRGLIDSLREDLNAPDLPIVIGEMGGGGNSPGEEEQQMRQIQSTVATEYNGVSLARTAVFNTGFDANDPNEVFDEFFHYYGRAEVIEKAGMEFASSMIELLDAGKLQLEEESPSPVPTLAPTTPETYLLPSNTPSASSNPSTVIPATSSPGDDDIPASSPGATTMPLSVEAKTTSLPTTTSKPPGDQDGGVYPFYGHKAFLNGRPMNPPNPYSNQSSNSGSRNSKSSKQSGGKGNLGTSKSSKSENNKNGAAMAMPSNGRSPNYSQPGAANRRRHDQLTFLRKVQPDHIAYKGGNRRRTLRRRGRRLPPI